jgi:hypothetical protein
MSGARPKRTRVADRRPTVKTVSRGSLPMKNGALAFRVTALAVMAAGLVAVLSWFSTASFKIDLAIIIVACLLAGYVAGQRRT